MPLADGLTDGLEHLKASVNARFPNRDKTSDGSWGDKAHQAETSGHNPDDTSGSKPEWNGDSDNVPEVRAWDMDSDLNDPDVSTDDFVLHILSLPNLATVLRYIIWNRHIWSASNGWVREDYTGASAHTEHVHFSGAYTNSADANTAFNYRLNDLGDSMTPDELLDYDSIPNPWGPTAGGGENITVRSAFYNAVLLSMRNGYALSDLTKLVNDLTGKVDTLIAASKK